MNQNTRLTHHPEQFFGVRLGPHVDHPILGGLLAVHQSRENLLLTGDRLIVGRGDNVAFEYFQQQQTGQEQHHDHEQCRGSGSFPPHAPPSANAHHAHAAGVSATSR